MLSIFTLRYMPTVTFLSCHTCLGQHDQEIYHTSFQDTCAVYEKRRNFIMLIKPLLHIYEGKPRFILTFEMNPPFVWTGKPRFISETMKKCQQMHIFILIKTKTKNFSCNHNITFINHFHRLFFVIQLCMEKFKTI